MFAIRMDLLISVPVYALIISFCWGMNNDSCKSPQYVDIAQVGTVQCSFSSFYAVAWYNAEDVVPGRSFIQLINGKKVGEGYTSGEFDIGMNGSLVFTNVTFQYDRNYTVFILESEDEDPVSLDVQVIVTVKPSIAYPVIDLCEEEYTACFKRLNRSSEVTCAVRDARPYISLSWTIRHFGQDRKILFQSSVTNNGALFTSLATLMNFFSNSSLLSVLVCKVDDIPELLLNDEAVILVENSDIDLSSVVIFRKYVEKNSRLQLRCSEANVSVIVWKKAEQDSPNFHVLSYAALFEKNASRTYLDDYELQKDGSLVLPRVEAKHEGLYECVFEGDTTGNSTQFEVAIFVTASPFVLGCPQDQYCVLLKQSEGSLTCSVKGIRPKVQLEWKTIHEEDSSLISFTERQITFTQIGDVFDVQLTSKYEIEQTATNRLTMGCSVVGPDIPALRLTTNFDLLISNVQPSLTEPTLIQPTDAATTSVNTHLLWLLMILFIPLVLIVILVYRHFIQKGVPQKQRGGKNSQEYYYETTLMRSTSPLKEKKTQFVTELQNKYKTLCGDIQPAPFLRDNYNINKLFVENGIKFLEDKKGESKEQENWTMLKDYKTVFTNPNIKSKRRIIDGEPGYGKSTLALQITHDWCQGIAPMNEFHILILLRLRQFRNIPTVYSAIKKFLLPKDSKLTENDLKSILDNSSSTVILLDGYDEYPNREKEDTDINHIIRGDMFQQHDVVLLTRTSCLPPDHSNTTIKRMRLTGFDDTSRETYIRDVVACGCSDVADDIITFLKVNPVPADLCKIPLFFAMISYMVKNSESFRNLKTVTQFFQHIIKCFHSHKEIKVTEENRKEELDHSTLDEVAFEGLSGDAQQICWGKNKLRSEIGNDLYDEYVRIGILIEEEGFDYITLEYNTETRFFHKLFAEWYAAHYLAKVAAQPDAEFEPWSEDELKFTFGPQRRAADTSQLHQAANSDEVHTLKSLNPKELHYMYRYACGLNPEAALKIIKHLGKNENYDECTLLCVTEWNGSLETIKDTVILLCSGSINIKDTHSLLLQKSTVALIEFACRPYQMIPMKGVSLVNCLDLGYNGTICIKPSCYIHIKPCNLHLPVIDTLSELTIRERGREITEEETDSILQYLVKCLGLKELSFEWCLVPGYIKVTESMSVLRQRDVKVKWSTVIGVCYHLNLESGQWEDPYRSLKPKTDEQYQEEMEEVRREAEERKQ